MVRNDIQFTLRAELKRRKRTILPPGLDHRFAHGDHDAPPGNADKVAAMTTLAGLTATRFLPLGGTMIKARARGRPR